MNISSIVASSILLTTTTVVLMIIGSSIAFLGYPKPLSPNLEKNPKTLIPKSRTLNPKTLYKALKPKIPKAVKPKP